MLLKFPSVNVIEYCGDILTKKVGACQEERVLESTERRAKLSQNMESKKKGQKFQERSGRSGAGVGVSSYVSYRCGETKYSPLAQTSTAYIIISTKYGPVKKEKSLRGEELSVTPRGLG